MLEKVKLALRRDDTDFDSEILDLIEESKADLKSNGIVNVFEEDLLIQRAIKLYCKANFGMDNKNSEKFQSAYDALKNHLALSGDYNGMQG